MTADQQNKLNAAQIAGDTVRRAMAWAANANPANTAVLADIVASDAARVAAGQTIQWDSESKLAAGMIPGTSGLTVAPAPFGGPGNVIVPATHVAPPPKNA